MRISIILAAFAVLPLFTCASAPSAMAQPVAVASRQSSITEAGVSWILASNTCSATVKFADGAIDLTSLVNKRTGHELLTGAGPRCLFRHTVDGAEFAAKDGKWTLAQAKVGEITAFGKHWGKSLTIDLSRPAEKLTVSLVFEIYDGDAGLRYGGIIQNDDGARERVISSSDILALNLPDEKHTIDFVPNQTHWGSTDGGLTKAKRNCLLRYANGDGLAVLPENNWCTSLTPGAAKGDPKEPFLFMNAFAGGDAGLRVYSNPKAVQLTLFPRERMEYFRVNLQPFSGDALDARAAVGEHFRKSFKYHDPLPQVDFQEYQVEYFQEDSMARQHLLPALAEAGFDRWEVTWRWNGSEGNDSALPRPGFTKDLPALVEYARGLGIKMGYYQTMTGGTWSGGRDLANPAEIAYKRAMVENILINRFQSTWQMIDLGELWMNDQPTGYSHPSDNVYRKYVNLRNYMSSMARAHPEFTMLTTCETENPNSAETDGAASNQCVSLMLIGENGQAGAYKRTDGARGYGDIQGNLRDAMNYIGLMPLEASVQTHGEESSPRDPRFTMFTPQASYASLLCGCSTWYSDVRQWTPAQRKFRKQFNDWRKSPTIGALLREVAHPLAIGEQNKGPYAWAYTNPAQTEALLIAVGFDGAPTTLSPQLRLLADGKTYLAEEITQISDGTVNHVLTGEFTGEQLKKRGLPINLETNGENCAAFLIREKTATFDGSDLPKGPGRRVVRIQGTRDAATLGAWQGKYGNLCAWLAGGKPEAQHGFSLATAAAQYVWGRADVDPRVPAPPSGGAKTAACWTAADTVSFEVGAPADKKYRLTAFILDYDKNGRAAEVTVIGNNPGQVFNKQTATAVETAEGIYLSWGVCGPATLTVHNTAGFNAAVSAVFVDEVK